MNKTIQVIGTLLLLMCGGCATVTTDDLHATGRGRTYDVPYSTAYRIALDALEEMKFSIKKADPSQGEIRAQTDRYLDGIVPCEGILIGVFLTQVGNLQTKMEIQGLYARPHDDLACLNKFQHTVSEYTQKLRQKLEQSELVKNRRSGAPIGER